MSESITISRASIETFLACERKFQLRYLSRSGWPKRPFTPAERDRMALGSIFHQMIAQHIRYPSYSGTGAQANTQLSNRSNDAAGLLTEPLAGWWHNFLNNGPELSQTGSTWVEKTLQHSILEKIYLLGRIDMLHLSEAGLSIYDWKTGRPRSMASLKSDWQTRLYLALVYEARVQFDASMLSPEAISITYWYAQAPKKSVEIHYDSAWHEQNWSEIKEIVSKIALGIEQEAGIWPLTSEEKRCTICPYYSICGRTGGKFENLELESDMDDARHELNSQRMAPDLSPVELDI